MSEIRRLDDGEMERIVERCDAAMLELYAKISGLSRDERILNGVKVYCRDMMMPYARHAGLWDQFVAEGFDDLADLTERAYPTLTGGSAQEVLGAVFIMGEGLVPEQGLPSAPPVGAELLPVLHSLALRGSSEFDEAEPLIDAGLATKTPVGYMLTDEGRRVHAELLERERASVDLKRLQAFYERFLAVNAPLKSISARAVDAQDGARVLLLDEVGELIERVEPALRRTAEVLPRFGAYPDRLRTALELAEAGDWNYVTSPGIDSVHTVWMEVHEDFLQTLGRSREAEGSY
jgi:hypothetical protein